MRVLALDYGQSNVGIAISDLTNKVARPLIILKNNRYLNSLLKKLVEQNGIGEIIIGLNVSLSGQLGEENRKRIEAFTGKISKLRVPIKFWDERFSTKTARSILKEQTKNSSGCRRVDDIAAALILQNYLDSK